MRGNLSTITDGVLFCGTAIDVTTTTIQYITCQFIPTHQYVPTRLKTHSTDTPHHQAHFLFSTDTGPLHSKLHEACTGVYWTIVSCMMRTCSPNNEWATAHALWHSRQVRAVCTERANWTSITDLANVPPLLFSLM